MKKIAKILSLFLMIATLIVGFGCGQSSQPDQSGQEDKRTAFEKIVDFVKGTGKDNSIVIEGSDPTEKIRISVVGNVIRLERGDGDYLPSDGISNTLQLDLKEGKEDFNYEGFWCQNGGARIYKITGVIDADKFDGSSVPIPYDTYSSYAKAPTVLELRILNAQMGTLITKVRDHIKNKINVDIFVEFGFDKFL